MAQTSTAEASPLMATMNASRRTSGAVVRELAGWGCLTRMHVVRLLAPRLDNEDHTKDVDFSPSGIRKRWEAGYAGTQTAIAQAPWQGEIDPLDGVILHEPRAEMTVVQVDGNLNPVAKSAAQMPECAPVLRVG